jgi:hypothetical protein
LRFRSRPCLTLAWSFAICFGAGCRSLSEVSANQCGNRVVEAGETCDGTPEKSCLPPGAAGECHFDCGLRTDGTRPKCPSASGCDIGGVCREATGGYLARSATITDNATSVVAADFDGDGRADVMSQESLSVVGATKFRLHFFDRDGTPAQTWISARPLISLVVGREPDAARSDVVFANGTLGVLAGQPDRTLISETYPSYFISNTRIRIGAPLTEGSVDGAAALLVLAEDARGLQLRCPDAQSVSLRDLTTFPSATLDSLAGPLAEGDLFSADLTDPCNDTAIAFRDATEVHVYSACRLDADTGFLGWREDVIEHVVPLVPPAPITRGPLIGDVNGDGHADLVIGTEGQAYVAYGDGQTLTAAEPWQARVDGELQPISQPLALGDFSGDGPADLVLPGGFLISRRNPAGEIDFYSSDHGLSEPWSAASIADLNANGMLDVIAVSETKLDIDFYNGTGSDSLNPFVIPTQRPVRELTVGDFDGDLVNDLAYLLVAPPSEPTEIMVSFGNVSGPPAAGIAAAHVAGVVQVGALNYDFTTQAAELFLAYEQPNTDGVDGSSFAWLSGFDRRLVCLSELTTFASDGSLQGSPALAVALGAFTRLGQRDALVLASEEWGTTDASLWLMPDLRNRTSQPEYVGWDLDPDVRPLRSVGTTATRGIPALDVLMAAGDFDADGLEELALAAPSADGANCHVSITQVREAGGSYQLQSHEAFSIELPCVRAGQIAIEDLDGDSALDIVLLLGRPDEPRSLLAFWNDGAGNFSANERLELARTDDVPEAFTLYRPTSGDRLRLAYVTRDRLRVLQVDPSGRGFEAAKSATDEIELDHATGVSAGDVDGDGIADLIVADSGSVILFRAQLRP